jgi:outer membrane lipopolysaccharide assembly protein LptE/RlpB
MSGKCENGHGMRGSFVLLAIFALPAVSGCGYHTLGSAAHLPDTVHTLAVPIFKNKTQFYHTEVPMTQAVVREFTDRTRLTVTPDAGDDADATVDGIIISESVQPLTYRTGTTTSGTSKPVADERPAETCPETGRITGSSTCQTGQTTSTTSSFLVTINVNVLVTDRDHRVLYQHDNYVFHEQFETTTDVTSFIEENSPAVQRLSRDFAEALVSDILESF